MANQVFVILEQNDGTIRKATLQLLSAARRLFKDKPISIVGVLLGHQVKAMIATAVAYGADQVVVADHLDLERYTTGAYTSVLNKIIRESKPEAVLIGNTGMGRDLAPRLAQRLGVGLASDCNGMDLDDTHFLTFQRPIYAGKAFAHIYTTERPILATIRPNTFMADTPDSSRQAEVIEFKVELSPSDLNSAILDIIKNISSRPELVEADIIVSGGRGLKSAANFKLLEELADVLGAAVGASRAAVDSGYRDYKYQVGQTGKTVSPTLYIACGISGAIQHIAGMGSSKVIVAINKDPEANIFAVADYGIVGDLFEVIPLLTEALKQRATRL